MARFTDVNDAFKILRNKKLEQKGFFCKKFVKVIWKEETY